MKIKVQDVKGRDVEIEADLQFQKVQHARRVIRATGGNVKLAAALLGVGKTTMYRWLKESE